MAKSREIAQPVRRLKPWIINTFAANFWFWLFWVCHLAFASVLYFYVQNKPFRIGSRSFGEGSSFLPLYQADVSAMISAAVSITKFFFQTWCGIVWWRIIYILLGTRHGIRLPELSSIAAGTPSPLPWRDRRTRGPLSIFFFSFICLVFVTQNFAAPFLLASISWNPIMQHGTTSLPLEFASAARESDAWSGYNLFSTGREEIGLSSAAYASRDSPLSFGTTVAMQRNFPTGQDIPPNSTVVDLLFPFILVDKFEWVADPGVTLSPDLISAVTSGESGYLNISSPFNPLTHPTIGNAALLRDTAWSSAPVKTTKEAPEIDEVKFPEPVSFNNERFLAVMVSRTHQIDDTTPCPTVSPDFGQLPDVKQLNIRYTLGDQPFALQCYVVAKVGLRAGSYRPPASTVVLPNVAEVVIATSQSFADRDLADPLTLAVLDAMPEVMRQMSIINATRAARWNDVEGYARGMILQAYQATWNVMTDKFRTESPIAQAYHPQYMIAMLIEPKWFAVWMGMISAGVMCGFVFICVANGREETGGVCDPALAAVRLDPRRVYKDVASLCSSADISKGDEKIRIRFAKKGAGRFSGDDAGPVAEDGYWPSSAPKMHHGHPRTETCQFGMLEALSGNEGDINDKW